MKILIDNGHGVETPGKRSPDGVLREFAWNRLIAARIVSALTDLSHDAQLLVPEQTDVPLPERCRRVNDYCRHLGRDNVLLISIHANAAGKGDRWYDATGWCAYTTRGDTRADALASCLYEAAKLHLPGQRIRTDYTDGEPDDTAINIKTEYEAKNGALSAAAPKVFFRYYFVNSATGERSVSMLAEAKYTVSSGG